MHCQKICFLWVQAPAGLLYLHPQPSQLDTGMGGCRLGLLWVFVIDWLGCICPVLPLSWFWGFFLCFFLILSAPNISLAMHKIGLKMHFFTEFAVGGMILLCLYYHRGTAKNASPFWKINNPQTQLDYFYVARTISSPAMCCKVFRPTVALPCRSDLMIPGDDTA